MASLSAGVVTEFQPHPPHVEPIEIRRLRQQTKNALQRVLIQVIDTPALCGSRERLRIADDIVHRIKLSVAISDALFGLTRRPEPLPERLKSLSESLIVLHTDEAQTIGQ
jgi:hypothetical protein